MNHPKEILHIAGEDGSGRATLILNYIYSEMKSQKVRCYVIDGEHKFTKKSFRKFGSLTDNVFIYRKPFDLPIKPILKTLLTSYPIVSNDYVIINSLSEDIKQKLALNTGYTGYLSTLQEFIEITVPYIGYFLQTAPCRVILRHQVSYNFEYGQNLPYFSQIMSILPGAWITLNKKSFQPINELTISYLSRIKQKIRHLQKTLEYDISGGDFIINTKI